ncbi:MAG: outer membrane beta-barrel protein [Leadbetterella sp.]|nr:outer membrane beta-barrel protein [Leadbetterella sp.]
MKHLFLILFIISTAVYGQEPVAIRGKILIHPQEPAGFASILLLQKAGISWVAATLTDSAGSFALKAVPGRYLLKIRYTGYKEREVEVVAADTAREIYLEPIVLIPDERVLQEVVVSAPKPFLEQRIDRLVVNLSGGVVNAGATAFEILQKVPGIVLVNNRITISGKSGVIIMINGKPSPYTDMESVIRDIPAAHIEKIELISHPGARFEASGNAGVINMVLKKNKYAGLNGDGVAGGGGSIYDQRPVKSEDKMYYRITNSLNLNYRKGNVNVFGSFDYLKRSVFEVNNMDRIIGDTFYKQTNYYPYHYHNLNYRTGVDYFISARSVIGLLLTGYDRNGQGTGVTYTDLLEESVLQKGFRTDVTTRIHRKNTTANINFSHKFDSTGKALNLDLDISKYNYRNQSDIWIADGLKNHWLQSGNTPLSYWTAKADFENPVRPTVKLETGFKVSKVKIENDLIFKRNGIPDLSRSSRFNYYESVYAAYGSVTKEYDKMRFQIGLRLENTANRGLLADSLVLKRKFLQLFPSFYFQKTFRSELNATVSYSRRLDRPNFQLLSPFEYFIDSLTYYKGNPTLLPQLTHAVKFSLSREKLPTLSFSYNFTRQVIYNEVPYQNGAVTFMHAENLGTFRNGVIELNYPFTIRKKVTGYSGAQAVHNSFYAPYQNTAYHRKMWNGQFYGGFTWKVSPALAAELNTYYSTGQLNEFARISASSGVNIGVQLSVWKDKGRLALQVNDVFYRNSVKSTIDFYPIHIRYFYRDDSRNFRLTFSYTFGKHKINKARERQSGSEEEERRL